MLTGTTSSKGHPELNARVTEGLEVITSLENSCSAKTDTTSDNTTSRRRPSLGAPARDTAQVRGPGPKPGPKQAASPNLYSSTSHPPNNDHKGTKGALQRGDVHN